MSRLDLLPLRRRQPRVQFRRNVVSHLFLHRGEIGHRPKVIRLEDDIFILGVCKLYVEGEFAPALDHTSGEDRPDVQFGPEGGDVDVDAQVGRLMADLKAQGLMENTIVVFGSARFSEKGPPDHQRWYNDARTFARIVSERGGALKESRVPKLTLRKGAA